LSSILDIDLDYFNQIPDPANALERLLAWADCPVSVLVDKHHMALPALKTRVHNGDLLSPTHILHVDEHHDMMDERKTVNIANWVYHAMCEWPACRVHWMVEHRVDSPRMWLSEEAWQKVSPRFTVGRHRPLTWPKPDFVLVCTSPEFIPSALGEALIERIRHLLI
jgi:hypothetical protein